MNTAQGDVKLVRQDISIQCELLLDGLHKPTQQFDIADRELRRRLMRRFYCLLMLEVVFIIPCLEILIQLQLLITTQTYVLIWVSMLLVNISLYIWREWRRTPPYNYLAYLFIILIAAITKSLFLQRFGHSRWSYAYSLIMSVELVILALYSKQNRVNFSLGIAILIIFVVIGLFLLLAYVFNIFLKPLGWMNCILDAIYIVYDTFLMLSGRHGYNVGPKEYFYAACNIYADLPKTLWILCKFSIFSPFVAIVRCFRYFCKSNVC